MKLIQKLLLGVILFGLNINVKHDLQLSIDWLSYAIADDSEDKDDDEEIEVIVITAPGGGWFGGGWGGGWSGGGGYGGGRGGGGGAPEPEPVPETDPERDKEICFAEANLQYRSCLNSVIGPNSEYQNTVLYICPLFVDVEVGAKIIFGSITVRNYDSCINVANAQRDGYINGCEINKAQHELQCIRQN